MAAVANNAWNMQMQHPTANHDATGAVDRRA
jgi:hypothetical protein